MTVTNTKARQTFAGDGSTTTFNINNIEFLNSTDLIVTLVDAIGGASEKTLTTDYTVSGGGGSTGSVTTTSFTPASGETLVVERADAQTQGLDITRSGPFSSQNVEQALDRAVLQRQRLQDLLDRCILIPKQETDGPHILQRAAARADQLFSFDANGRPTTVSGADKSSDTVTAAASDNARSLANRFAEIWRDVKDFDDDGTITEADVKAAYQALPTDAAGNRSGILFFPPGLTTRLQRDGSNDWAVRFDKAGHIILMAYGHTFDVQVDEASAGRGACAFSWRGGSGNRLSSLTVLGGVFDGSNAGTNADAFWLNPRGAACHILNPTTAGGSTGMGPGTAKLRHFFVHVDSTNSGAESAPNLKIEGPGNLVSCSGVPVILASSDSPVIRDLRIKDNGDWAIEIGQSGDRSFAGNTLSGAVSQYEVSGCIIEKNDGGVLLVNGSGGNIQADFEANDGASATRADAGTAIRAHLDFTGTGTSGTGDQSGGTYGPMCTFSGDQMNVKLRDGTVGLGALHKDGEPGLSPWGDSHPAYCPFDRYKNGVTTKLGQEIDLTDTDNTGTFTTGETVTGGTSSATGRVIGWDAGTGSLTVTWKSGLFQVGETVTGGTSGATLNNLDAITLHGTAGVIRTPSWFTAEIQDLSVADNNNGVKRTPKFDLDHRALVLLGGGLEDASANKSASYQWYVRNVTDGTVLSPTALINTGLTFGTLGNNEWLPVAVLIGQKADGDEFGVWVRNQGSGGAKNLTGMVAWTVADVNVS